VPIMIPRGSRLMWKVIQFVEALLLIVVLVPILLILYPLHIVNEKVFG
jgi:hypothetical protein